METLRLWITGLCIGAITGSLILFLSPSGATAKSIRTIVGVFLICVTVMPILSGKEKIDFSLDIPENEYNQNQTDIINTAGEQLKSEIEEDIINQLQSVGAEVQRVDTDININGDEISVEKITVILKKEDMQKASQIKALIKENLGLITEVEYEVKGD